MTRCRICRNRIAGTPWSGKYKNPYGKGMIFFSDIMWQDQHTGTVFDPEVEPSGIIEDICKIDLIKIQKIIEKKVTKI
jgi:hypothetical protein